MAKEGQRVMVIQDASRNISLTAIKWILQGFELEPGDSLILLSVLHQVNTPSTFPFVGAKNLLGYKSRVGSSSLLGANKKIIKDAIAKKLEEYDRCTELADIRKLYETNQVELNIKVVPASSPKTVALDVAKRLKTTWIILDRQMKKDKKYFLENLSCGISRMKRDRSVEELRGPKSKGINNMHIKASRSSTVTYDEMIPGTPDGHILPGTPDDKMIQGTTEDLFSLDISPITTRTANHSNLIQEPRTDIGKEPPSNCVTSPSFSKSTSSECLQPPRPNMRKHEASSHCSSKEGKHSTIEEESYTVSKDTAALTTADINPDSEKLDLAEDNEILYQETRQRQSSIDTQELLSSGLAVHSTCSDCKNGRPKIGSTTDFTYAELEAATKKFCKDNYLSEGGFGSVYKGKLKNGLMIAVKQHKLASLQGEREFKSEVHVLSKARHKHVVMLLGSCSEGSHRLLVYEFVCNGSLDTHLSEKNPKILSWNNRMKIALGAAKGLKYLHQNNIIHRDMRPNNILITHDYEPLLGDFGLARTQHEGSDHSSDNRVVGTFGYVAPEYAESGKVSTKTDVYSFGVVLLELITGRRTMDKTLGEKSLIEWARPLLKERKYPDLIDPRILDSHDVHQLFWMVRVAEECLSKDPERRLSIEEVVNALQLIIVEDKDNHIEDSSPGKSDSDNVTAGPYNTNDDNKPLTERQLSPAISPTSSWSPSTEAFSTVSSAKSSSTRSSITPKSSASEARKGDKNKRKGMANKHLPYGEMLD